MIIVGIVLQIVLIGQVRAPIQKLDDMYRSRVIANQMEQDRNNAPLINLLREQQRVSMIREERLNSLNHMDVYIHRALETINSHATDIKDTKRLMHAWKELAKAYEIKDKCLIPSQ